MAVNITPEMMKRDFLTRIADDDLSHDDSIQATIDSVLALAVEYIDYETAGTYPAITSHEDLPSVLTRPLMKQIAFEYSRRNDVGLSAVSIGEANIAKIEADEWLPSTKAILDRMYWISLGSSGL